MEIWKEMCKQFRGNIEPLAGFDDWLFTRIETSSDLTDSFFIFSFLFKKFR